MGSNSEHWRTICVCTICGQTPDLAPLYKCRVGHTYCNPCYEQLKTRHRDGQLICSLCGCKEFRVDKRGEDFLKKLRVKPGIGRPYRYKINNADSISSPAENDKPSVQEPAVTVEQLFRLRKEDLSILFADQTKQKIRNAASPVPPRMSKSIASTHEGDKIIMHKDFSKGENLSNTSVWLTQSSQKTLHSRQSCYSFAQSKKPLRCPHDPCKKTVAVSSFLNHFKHEHPQIKRYNVDRGMQLVIPCNASHIEHDVTFCLAMITVYDVGNIKLNPNAVPNVANVCNRLNAKVPINTFWLLVSGSPDDKFSFAYALYWLFTSNNNNYTCTLEMASANDATSYSTFCGVNGTNDSQEIHDVAQRLNCLYLTKGCLMALLEDGSDLRLGITIH